MMKPFVCLLPVMMKLLRHGGRTVCVVVLLANLPPNRMTQPTWPHPVNRASRSHRTMRRKPRRESLKLSPKRLMRKRPLTSTPSPVR